MTVNSYKLDDGTLKLGAAGVMDISCQVTSAIAQASENVSTTDAIPVLCGDEVPEEDEVKLNWTLSFNVVQDLDAAGVIAWSYTNKGTEQDFEFIPTTAGARKVTGTVRVIPIAIGGDVRTRPQAENTWQGKKGEDFVFAAVV